MNTPAAVRNRTRRWYLVVQARRLLDAGYSQKETGERLGIASRSLRRWKNDRELWAAAAVAPDHEAVGPPKRTTSVALRTLQDTTAELAKERQKLERRFSPPADDPDEVEQKHPRETAFAPPDEPEERKGRYVGLTGTHLGNGVERHEHDPAPLDVTGELALTRALLERVALAIEHDEGVDLDAVKIVARLLDQVSKMAHRIETIRAHDSISRKDFVRIMSEMGKAVRLYCTPEQARKVSEHIMALRL